MKILKNTTGSDIDLDELGITVPASSSVTIAPGDYLILADDVVLTEINIHLITGDIVVNDGVDDLSAARGLDYLKYSDRAFRVRFEAEPERSNGFISKNVQEAIEETHAASITADFSPWSMQAGTSARIPFLTTEYQTQSGMHDPSIGESGTATGTHSSTTLQDTSKTWTTNQFANYILKITGGTGSGQWRLVSSNNSNTLTVSSAFHVTPDNTSTYELYLDASKIYAIVDGIYKITAHASAAYQSNLLGIFIYVNGAFKRLNYTHQSQNVELQNGFTTDLELSAGDYVEMSVYNGGMAGLALFGGSARLYLQVSRLG